MNSKIWLSSPHMGGMEKVFIDDAFHNNWVAPVGPSIIEFEKSIKSYTGIAHAVALSSGTSAIHLALIMLGAAAGDEVICQSLTFIATANPIVYVGATPVFVDSEKNSWNMDPEALETAIKDRLQKGKKVKAIIVVHLYGMPANMIVINEIGEKYGIPIVEDAAESLGSKIGDQQTGTFGVMGVLSFNGNKIITTSGGGALLSNDEHYTKKAIFFATQAREDEIFYQHEEVGYNYRMSNISACIGRGQMMVLDERIASRRANFDFYKKELQDLPGIAFQEEREDSFSNRWLTAILINREKSNGMSRSKLSVALLKDNIESRPIWKPLHLQPIFKGCACYGGQVTENLFAEGLCLPSGSNLSPSDLKRVTSIIIEQFENSKFSS